MGIIRIIVKRILAIPFMRKSIIKTRRFLNVLKGQDEFVFKPVNCRLTKFGETNNEYCIANEERFLHGVVLSFGVGESILFEKKLTEIITSDIHMFDPSQISKRFIETQALGNQLQFHNYGLSDKYGKNYFGRISDQNIHYRRINEIESYNYKEVLEFECETFERLLDILEINEISLIKLDIEGEEFRVLNSIFCSELRPKQIAVELHHRFFPDPKSELRKVKEIAKLNNYTVAWISDCGYDYLFIDESIL